MEENLVGYLLNALDEDSQQEVEAYLRDDPAAQKRLEVLRQALEPLAADRDEIAPPAGLAIRTLAQVAEFRCRPVPEPPPAPVPALSVGRGYPWWRRANTLVAASICLVVGGLLFQGVSGMRATAARVDCAYNLHNFHNALMTYSDQHDGEFPGVPLQRGQADPPLDPLDPPAQPGRDLSRYNVAGIFVVQLRDSGSLGANEVSIRCPANGMKSPPKVSFDTLQNMSPAEFEAAAQRLVICYAYSLGYRGDPPAREHCGLRISSDLNNDLLPIMADRPSILPEGGRGISRNHNGQNVLYVGGNVRFCTSSNVGIEGNDIFVNQEGKVAAGVNRRDAPLGCSGDRP